MKNILQRTTSALSDIRWELSQGWLKWWWRIIIVASFLLGTYIGWKL